MLLPRSSLSPTMLLTALALLALTSFPSPASAAAVSRARRASADLEQDEVKDENLGMIGTVRSE